MPRRVADRPTKQSRSFRLSEECLRMMQEDADSLGIERTAVLELAVRAYHRSNACGLAAERRRSDLGPEYREDPPNVK